MRRLFLLLVFLTVGPLAVRAQPDPEPLDISKDLLPRLRESLPGYQFADTGTLLHVTAPNGAQTGIVVARTRYGCVTPEACGRFYAERYAKVLGPADPPQLRLHLTLADRNVNPGPDGKLRPWLAPAFGPFLRECRKGDGKDAPPLTQWDTESQGIAIETLVAQCEEATRKAQKPLDGKALAKRTPGLFSSRGFFVEPNAAARFLFPEQWADLAREFGGGLIVIAMEEDHLVYAKGNDRNAADAAIAWAKDIVTMAQKVRPRTVVPFCLDAWRWDGSAWTLLTPHPVADQVLAGIRADFPNKKVKIVDSGSILFETPDSAPVKLSLQYVNGLCRDDPKACPAKTESWMRDYLYPVLRGQSFMLPAGGDRWFD